MFSLHRAGRNDDAKHAEFHGHGWVLARRLFSAWASVLALDRRSTARIEDRVDPWQQLAERKGPR
jgi:hypothetical protein